MIKLSEKEIEELKIRYVSILSNSKQKTHYSAYMIGEAMGRILQILHSHKIKIAEHQEYLSTVIDDEFAEWLLHGMSDTRKQFLLWDQNDIK